jgi:hypothetical protein
MRGKGFGYAPRRSIWITAGNPDYAILLIFIIFNIYTIS